MSTVCPTPTERQGSTVPSEVAPFAGVCPGFMSKPTTVTSAPVRMNVLVESLLLPLSGSAVEEDTEALFVTTSETVEVASVCIVMVTLPAGTRLPTLQGTVPAASVHEPWLALADTKGTCEGSV